MPDLSARIRELRAMDNLSAGTSVIHRLHPLVKLLSTLVYIVFVASYGRYDFVRLAPYTFYPFIMVALAELPYKTLLPRVLIALPFCLFAGLANVFFDRATAVVVADVAVSYGTLSLLTIILKMYLCVMAALLLVASTPFTELTAQLRRLRVPAVFVMVFELTFRYIGVLIEEAFSMTTAYKLRSGNKRALDIRHMGSFTGLLILRGLDRAERVHAAMRCRGYSLTKIPHARRRLQRLDVIVLIAICLPTVLLRIYTFL